MRCKKISRGRARGPRGRVQGRMRGPIGTAAGAALGAALAAAAAVSGPGLGYAQVGAAADGRKGAGAGAAAGAALGGGAARAGEPAAVAGFDPGGLTPYFTSGPMAQATQRLRSGDAGTAARLIADFVSGSAVEPPKTAADAIPPATPADATSDPRVRFLLAVAQLRSAQALPGGPERTTLARRAAQNFDGLATSYPLLGSYHALYAARAYLLGEQPADALVRIERVPSSSVLDCDARFLRGEAQSRLPVPKDGKDKDGGANKEKAIAAYRAYLGACPGGRKHDAQVRLAELLDTVGRPAEALQLWRRLYVEAPTEGYGALAQKRLEQPGVKAAPFSPAELLERAEVLFEQMRNPESESAYRWVLEMPDSDAGQRCTARYHLAQSVFKQRQRPRAAPLFDEAVRACAPDAAKNDDLHMKALYQSARCHASAGELQVAADLFAQAELAHPGHSYADDARVRQAEMYQDLADRVVKDGAKKTCQADACPDYETKMAALLSDLPERYPAGDKRAEALWRLAFRSYRRGDLPAAHKWLEASLQRVPHETGWDQEGRTLYWLGRLAELGSDRATALSFYRRTAQEYPLSFYTLLAFARLRDGFGGELDKLVGELGEAGRAANAGDDVFTFQPRVLFAQPGFVRGVELLRLGLGTEAKREFRAVGIAAPEEKGKKVSSPEEEELLWLAAVLYDRAGAWDLSHFIPRHVLTDWQRHYPVGPWRKKWLLAYPRGYADLLTSAAQDNRHPESLQFAIVREESAFDPLTESFANAVGLTQMIPPTAKRFSGGLRFDREALRDPATNVAIGARFLGFLWAAMKGNPGLAIASYNAGENAVFRWLKNYADLKELDAFIEAIPYDETRGYTKRVLSSYLTYEWLQPPPTAPVPTPPAQAQQAGGKPVQAPPPPQSHPTATPAQRLIPPLLFALPPPR